jgi:hypothetical protein
MYTAITLALKLSLFQQFLIKFKNQQIKWYQRHCIQPLQNLKNDRECKQSVTILAVHTVLFSCIKYSVAYIQDVSASYILLYSFYVRQFLV